MKYFGYAFRGFGDHPNCYRLRNCVTILFFTRLVCVEERLASLFSKCNSNNLSLGSFYQLCCRVDTVSGNMFGHPGDSSMNWVHANVFRLFPYEFEECSTNSFGSIGDYMEVLNLNNLFFNLKRFICNYTKHDMYCHQF